MDGLPLEYNGSLPQRPQDGVKQQVVSHHEALDLHLTLITW